MKFNVKIRNRRCHERKYTFNYIHKCISNFALLNAIKAIEIVCQWNTSIVDRDMKLGEKEIKHNSFDIPSLFTAFPHRYKASLGENFFVSVCFLVSICSVNLMVRGNCNLLKVHKRNNRVDSYVLKKFLFSFTVMTLGTFDLKNQQNH